MRMRILLVPVLLAVLVGVAHTQPPPPPSIPAPSLDSPQALAPSVPATPPPQAPEPSLDQLLDRMEALRGQKADLERREQELMKEIRRKMGKQTERLNKLGIAPAALPTVPTVSTTTGAVELSPAPSATTRIP